MSSIEQKSGNAPSAVQPNSSSPNSVTTNNTTYRLPCDATLQNATKLSIVEDKPVMFDYWTDSLDKKALIGFVKKTKFWDKLSAAQMLGKYFQLWSDKLEIGTSTGQPFPVQMDISPELKDLIEKIIQ